VELIKKIFADNLKAGILLGIISILASIFAGGPIIGTIIGIFGFLKSKKALKEGKSLAILGAILSIIPILYALFVFFVLGYVFTK